MERDARRNGAGKPLRLNPQRNRNDCDDPKAGQSQKPRGLKSAEYVALSRPKYFTSHAALRRSENKADCGASPMRQSLHLFSHCRKDQPWRPKELNSVLREWCALAAPVSQTAGL